MIVRVAPTPTLVVASSVTSWKGCPTNCSLTIAVAVLNAVIFLSLLEALCLVRQCALEFGESGVVGNSVVMITMLFPRLQ